MLSVSKYSQEYVDDCRARVTSQVATYGDLVKAARQTNAKDGARLESAIDAFEPQFFGNLLLALDNLFCHRARTTEGKDGNPLNEARVVCNSLMTNHGVMLADKTIRLKPDKSLLKYLAGDEISLSEGDFVRLADAFFDEIERKFT